MASARSAGKLASKNSCCCVNDYQPSSIAESFFQIKKWFLEEFSELKQARKEYREKVQKIYEAAEAKAAA